MLGILQEEIISLIRKIDNPKIVITIENNYVIFEDNCGKIERDLLRKINKKQYSGLGIKMAKEIAIKNNKKMLIYNNETGAVFKFVKLKTNLS